MTENEKLLLSALEQLQQTHSATVEALNARMMKLENAYVALANNQQKQADILQNLQDDRGALEQLLSDFGNTLNALKRM